MQKKEISHNCNLMISNEQQATWITNHSSPLHCSPSVVFPLVCSVGGSHLHCCLINSGYYKEHSAVNALFQLQMEIDSKKKSTQKFLQRNNVLGL